MYVTEFDFVQPQPKTIYENSMLSL